MKKYFGLFALQVVLSIVCSEASAQDAKQIFKQVVAEFLEEGGIIESQASINSMPESKKKQKKNKEKAQATRDYFISKFRIPSEFTEFNVLPKFKYDNMPLSSIGSMVFDKERLPVNSDSIVNRRLPLLLVSDDLSQVAMENPSDNNYDLYINLLSYMDWVLDASADASYGDIARAKTEVALKKTFSDKKTLSVAYGYFQNRLATVFNEVQASEKLSDFKDFAPLFDAWVQQSVNPTLADKYIIDGFNALIVEQASNSLFLGNTSLEAMGELNVNVPFLRANASTSYNWRSEKEMRKNVKSLAVYFNSEPNFVKIPSAEKIYRAWQYVTMSKNNNVIYEDGKILTISDFMNDEPIIKVLFGPLPGPEYKSDLAVRISSVDANSAEYLLEPTILDFNQVPEDIQENMNQGLYYIPIILKLDKNKIRTNSLVHPKMFINANIEVYHKKTCRVDGVDRQLSTVYPVQISLNTGPAIRARTINSTVDSARNEQGWELLVSTTDEVSTLEVVGFSFDISELSPYEEDLKLNCVTTKVDGNPLNWTVRTTGRLLDGEKDYGTNLKTTVEFEISNGDDEDLLLQRSAKTLLPVNYYKKVIDPVVIRASIEELVPLIPDSIKLADGQKAKTVLVSPTESDSTKLKAVEELIRETIIVPQNSVFKLFGVKTIARPVKKKP